MTPSLTRAIKVAALALASLIALSATAQAQAGGAPKFKDHPVRTIFKGKPAPPALETGFEQDRREYFERAAARGVTFAGHYSVIRLPCGATCVDPVILDLQSGKTVKVGFSISGWRKYHKGFEPIVFRRDSALIVFLGARNEKLPLGTHYYVLENGVLKLLRTIENDGNFLKPLAKD